MRLSKQCGHREIKAVTPDNAIKAICRLLSMVATVTAVIVVTPGSVHSQEGIENDAVYQSWLRHSGVKECGQCHYERGATFGNLDTSLSRQGELKSWLAYDKHSIARRRVEPLTLPEIETEAEALMAEYGADVGIVKGWLGASNVLSERICRQLGYDIKSKAGYEQFRDNCLSCHGGYRSDVAADAREFENGQPGISCNYCHQVGDKAQWVQVHGLKRDQWRAGSPAQKESLGMRDLVTTSTQANLCFDCHIGNRSEDKFVTHEMYAAGHPPLPSIELQTFAEQMPQHWQTMSETTKAMPAPFRESYMKANFPGLDQSSPTYWNTRALLVGALTARAKSVDLLIESHAMNKWADYSLYDCSACHHELKTSSRRQQRGYPAAPGRPRQAEWTDLQLFHIGTFLAEDEPEIMELESDLIRRFGEKPFGDADRVSETASKLRARLQTAIETAESTPIDQRIATGVLRGLARTPRDQLLSYDAARQVVWAIKVVAAEMKAAGTLDPRLEPAIAVLDQAGVIGLATKLPAGREQFIYQQGLAADLDRRAKFDPAALLEQLGKIGAVIDPDGDARADRPSGTSRLTGTPSR